MAAVLDRSDSAAVSGRPALALPYLWYRALGLSIDGNSHQIASGEIVPILVTTDMTPEAWDAFVSTQPQANGYHQWRWRQVIERGLGHRCHYYVAQQDGRIVGILPTAKCDGRWWAARSARYRT